MARAIICPHCGSHRINPQSRKGFYQCHGCDAYIDARTRGDYISQTVAKSLRYLGVGLLTFGLFNEDILPDDILDDLF